MCTSIKRKGCSFMNKRLFKIVVYVTLLVMLVSTLLMSIGSLLQ
ncbi:stressosome-associated protein Prli42 [Cohnella terricola]